MVFAVNDGHYDAESAFAGMMKENHAMCVADKTLPYIVVGGKKYKDPHYTKNVLVVSGRMQNLEVWQLVDNGTEYTLIALAPARLNKLTEGFITRNLVLLPLPALDEDEFINTVTSIDEKLQQKGGAKLSDEIIMTSVEADRERKEYIRTFQFTPTLSDLEVALASTREFTYDIMKEDAENNKFVKDAIALGYKVGIIWKDKDGNVIATHKFDFNNPENTTE